MNADKVIVRLACQWRAAFSLAAQWMGRTDYLSERDCRVEAASREADHYMAQICETKAASMAGIITKLSVALEWNRLAPADMEDPPWRCVESAFHDLRRLTGNQQDLMEKA